MRQALYRSSFLPSVSISPPPLVRKNMDVCYGASSKGHPNTPKDVWIKKNLMNRDQICSMMKQKVDGVCLQDMAECATFKNVVDHIERPGGRHEMRLQRRWVEKASNAIPEFRRLNSEIERFRYKNNVCSNAAIDWFIMNVVPNAKEQSSHIDHGHKKCYYTFIVPLTKDVDGSGTAFDFASEKTPSLVLNPYGGMLIFKGNVYHHGTAHRSKKPRRFLYAVLTTGCDFNT